MATNTKQAWTRSEIEKTSLVLTAAVSWLFDWCTSEQAVGVHWKRIAVYERGRIHELGSASEKLAKQPPQLEPGAVLTVYRHVAVA